MKKLINFGSLNLDHVYQIEEFVRPGETRSADAYQIHVGGKGLNQSVAASRAGAEVVHAGRIGRGGERLEDYLHSNGVDTTFLQTEETAQGHAVIQVNGQGENCILLFAGSNHSLDSAYIDEVLASFNPPAFVLFQNETSCVEYGIAAAHAAGFEVVFNASPYEQSLREIDFHAISWLLINETEGKGLTGLEEPEAIVEDLTTRFPSMGVVLTLGGQGCLCEKNGIRVAAPAFPVAVVDTTGAGDTFTGYFLAALAGDCSLEQAVKRASAAAALAVMRPGTAESIPVDGEVNAFLRQRDSV